MGARYFAVPFTVPEGVREIEVRHDDQSEANILDWGLRDPTRFRGWGGGNTEPAIVSEAAASRSYVAGAIAAGQWAVMIGQAKVTERPARYRIEIVLRTTPTLAPQTERRPYAAAPALAVGPRWYAGDFHVHSSESGDASPTLDEVATFARTRGLDFVELSEHNVVTATDFIVDAQARHRSVLFVPGTEFTTYGGHANAIGATEWVDFTASTGPMTSARAAVDAITAQGALFAINHPTLDLGDLCIGCAWSLDVQPERIAAVEIQNGRYSVTGPLFYRTALAFWDGLLSARRARRAHRRQRRSPRRCGHGNVRQPHRRRDHDGLRDASSASPAILAAVRAGRTVVKLQGPDDPMVDLRAGDAHHRRHDPRAPARRCAPRSRARPARRSASSATERPSATSRSPPTPSQRRTRSNAPAGSPPTTAGAASSRLNGQPRVVTGHLWIAAAGAPPALDAGVSPDVSALDGARPPGSSTGCACSARVTRSHNTWWLAALGVILAARRPRRARGHRLTR